MRRTFLRTSCAPSAGSGAGTVRSPVAMHRLLPVEGAGSLLYWGEESVTLEAPSRGVAVASVSSLKCVDIVAKTR